MPPPALIAAPLWLRARAMFARATRALNVFGALAALGPLPRALRREIMGWLAPLEMIVRKLLLAEAARLAPQTRRPLSPLALKCLRQIPRTPAPAFSLRPPRDCRRARLCPSIRSFDQLRQTPPPPARARANAGPDGKALSRRFAALARVLAHPLRHARRLSRLIAAIRPRFPEIALRYASAPLNIMSRDREDLRLHVSAIAAARAAIGADTS